MCKFSSQTMKMEVTEKCNMMTFDPEIVNVWLISIILSLSVCMYIRQCVSGSDLD